MKFSGSYICLVKALSSFFYQVQEGKFLGKVQNMLWKPPDILSPVEGPTILLLHLLHKDELKTSFLCAVIKTKQSNQDSYSEQTTVARI